MLHAVAEISGGNGVGAAERARAVPSPSLLFVDHPGQADSWIAACSDLIEAGKTKIGIRILDGAFAAIGARLIEQFGDRLVSLDGPNDDGGPKQASRTETSAVLLLGGDADCVSAALMDYADDMAAMVLAPVTERFWNRLPLYLISIPKAGTHLLFQLAEALGYRSGGPSPESPTGGCWYYLLNTNAHTGANEFFLEATQRAPFGNRAHPFLRSPALFNYRHPLDILASEASYFHLDGKSPLSVLLSPLSFDERAVLLADDPWLVGSIRDRVGRFLPWLGCTNVIPVSFEEMVGAAGGGTDAALERLVWSLQLKLHVPGNPQSFRAAIKRESSPTFREGRIGGWKDKLPAAAVQRVRGLPQDFMAAFGYELDSVGDAWPAQAEARRRRPLAFSRAEFAKTPILIATNVLGYNIVSLRKCFFAVPIALGELDLATLSETELAGFLRGNTQLEIFAALIAKTARDAEWSRQAATEPAAQEPVTLQPIRDFVITALPDRVVALRRDCGPLDTTLDDAAIRERYAPDDVIIEPSRTDIATSIALRKAVQSEQVLAELREDLAATPDALLTVVRNELQTQLAAGTDAMRAVVRDELVAMSDVMRALVNDELQTQLTTGTDALRTMMRDELVAMSDAMRALVSDEPQTQLAAGTDALRAMVRDELVANRDAVRVLVRDELEARLAATPDAMRALVREELQVLRALDRNGAVRCRGGFLGYNIFQRLDDTIAVPRRLGAIDPADPSLRERPGVIAARGANAVRLAVMWCWIRWAYWDGAKS